MINSGFTFLLQWQQFVQFTFVFCVKFFKILKKSILRISFKNWIEFLNLPHIHLTNPSNPWDIVPNRNLILRPCCQRLQDSWRVQSSSGKFSFFAICFDFVSTSADLLTSFWSVAERERWEKIRKSWKWKCQQRQKKLLSSETGKTGIVKVNLWIWIFYIFNLFNVFEVERLREFFKRNCSVSKKTVKIGIWKKWQIRNPDSNHDFSIHWENLKIGKIIWILPRNFIMIA